MEEKDYKKLYENVLERAKNGLKDKNYYLSQSAKEVTEFLFPQLKETEDEKVRRELTRFLINFNNGYYSKPSETEIDSWIKWIDKKCEQNPTDEVKPKFKVGDWIVQENIGVYKVIEVCESWYEVIDFEDNHYSISFDKEYMCHLWTIEDAKDGDVLAEHETIVLFKKIEDQNIRCYCTYHYLGFNPTFYVGTLQNKNPYSPATKEQHDILFKKMKEEGYEWDAEKKELNKIEKQGKQKPIIIIPQFKVGDIIKPKPYNEEHLIKDINENGYVLDVDIIIPFKDEDVWEIVEQKTAWSEEDEQNLNFWLDNNKSIDSDKRNWLKSLKDRVQPQPKQEWSQEDTKRIQRIHDFIWKNRKGDTDEIFQQEQDANWLMTFVPQPKQEWSEDDEEKFRDVIRLVEQGAPVQSIRDHYTNWLKSLKDRFQLQPKQEWSEEDKNMLLSIINDAEQDALLDKEQINWLKSLKDRFQLQPKQELSKEDEEKLNEIAKYLKYKGYEDDSIWLKYLKQKYHWKPSEEQMNALDKAKNSPANYHDIRLGLQSLYNDLLKL